MHQLETENTGVDEVLLVELVNEALGAGALVTGSESGHAFGLQAGGGVGGVYCQEGEGSEAGGVFKGQAHCVLHSDAFN